MELTGKTIDLYELNYRSYKSSEISMETKFHEEVIQTVYGFVNDLLNGKIMSKDINEIMFSDVVYNLIPITKEKMVAYEYIPMYRNGKTEIEIDDYITRFNNLKIDDLPLIEVANILGITVEKSNCIESYGNYNISKKKITVGTDYGPTFIHELVHAVDIGLLNNRYDLNLCELIAELTTIILCEQNNIEYNISFSYYYLCCYNNAEINVTELTQRVFHNLEFITKCLKIIKPSREAMMDDRALEGFSI